MYQTLVKIKKSNISSHINGDLQKLHNLAGNGAIVVVMRSDPERSIVEETPDDRYQPSYRRHPLSEATEVSLSTRRLHWKDTRLSTRLPPEYTTAIVVYIINT